VFIVAQPNAAARRARWEMALAATPDTVHMIRGVRFVIYGAGAIGGVLGARLHESGQDVLLIARGAHYEAIRSAGLELVGPDASRSRHQIPVVDRIAGADIGPQDVVLLAMKSQDTAAALLELAEVAPPEIAVACVQNGVYNERAALRLFANVYGVMVLSPASHLTPGVVQIDAGPQSGVLDVGRYPHGSDNTAREIVHALSGATYLSDLVNDVMAWKYAKLLVNLENALSALFGPDAAIERLGETLIAEGDAALRAGAIPVISRDEFRARSALLNRALGGRVGNSTLQSVLRGTGSVETDYLNGEIVLLGRLHDVPTPANELVQRLTRELVGRGDAAASLRVKDVERALGL
jgi:2-dehydropantoate 2-reductase